MIYPKYYVQRLSIYGGQAMSLEDAALLPVNLHSAMVIPLDHASDMGWAQPDIGRLPLSIESVNYTICVFAPHGMYMQSYHHDFREGVTLSGNRLTCDRPLYRLYPAYEVLEEKVKGAGNLKLWQFIA